MKTEFESITFRELDRNAGHEVDEQTWESLVNQGSLPAWHREVYDTPFGQFTDFDLCRSLRQTLYLNEVIPVAITRCLEDPAAGDHVDADLAVHIIEHGSEFLQSHPDELKRFLSVIPEAISASYVPEDQDFLRSFLERHK